MCQGLMKHSIETEAEGILKGAVLLDIPAVRLEGSDALYSEEATETKVCNSKGYTILYVGESRT